MCEVGGQEYLGGKRGVLSGRTLALPETKEPPMTVRLRFAVALAAALTAVATPAWAGPSDRQPAQVRLTLGEARYYARTGAGYLASALAKPQKPHVGECRTGDLGRKLWRCDATVQGEDVRCSLTVWVWGDHDGDRWYEYHQIHCHSA